MPLYTDRPYHIEGKHRLVSQSFVVPIPRHLKTPIYLMLTKNTTVYRLLSDVNPNTEFMGWNIDVEPIYAPGSNYVGNPNRLTSTVSHEFGPGKLKIPAGGPRFAAPILVTTDGDITAHTVRFFNKIIGSPISNKKKLLSAFLFVIVVNLIAHAFLFHENP